MAMLNFKYGLHTNLVAKNADGNLKVPVNNGTIYVTTDEHAMYVDLNDSRIRISQIVSLANITEWQKLTPPYNTECFYYIVDANALLKCNGTNADGTGIWVQINSTAELDNAVKAIDERLKTVEGDVTTLKADYTTLSSDYTTFKKDTNDTLTSYGETIGDLGEQITAANTDITNLEAVIGYRGAVNATSDVENPADNDICSVNGVVYRYDATEGKWEEYGDIVEVIEKLRADIVAANGGFVTTTEFNTLSETVKGKADLVSGATAGHLAGLDADGNLTDSGIDASTVATTTAVQEAKDAADAAQKTADEADKLAGENKAAIELLQSGKINVVSGATAGNVTTMTTEGHVADSGVALTDLAKSADVAKDLAEADTKAQGYADAVQGDTDKTVADAMTAAGEASAAVNTLSGTVDANKKAAEDAIKELEDSIVANMQTADAMVFQDVVDCASATEEELAAGAKPLPTTAEKGWTYKATKEFVIGEGDDAVIVYIGDLLIASGEEDENGVINDIEWKHIPSGYVADYNPEMDVVSADGSNIATIYLTSGANKDSTLDSDQGDLGTVVLSAAADSAMTISLAKDSDADVSNIVIGMAWSSFDEV